eukprot:1156294-Pelagomonas_calceolata.AAC.3
MLSTPLHSTPSPPSWHGFHALQHMVTLQARHASQPSIGLIVIHVTWVLHTHHTPASPSCTLDTGVPVPHIINSCTCPSDLKLVWMSLTFHTSATFPHI